jgi:hypothetical protein
VDDNNARAGLWIIPRKLIAFHELTEKVTRPFLIADLQSSPGGPAPEFGTLDAGTKQLE